MCYGAAMPDQPNDPLRGLTEKERRIMGALLRQPPEKHKDVPKPDTGKARAQRQRRQREREAATASHVA